MSSAQYLVQTRQAGEAWTTHERHANRDQAIQSAARFARTRGPSYEWQGKMLDLYAHPLVRVRVGAAVLLQYDKGVVVVAADMARPGAVQA